MSAYVIVSRTLAAVSLLLSVSCGNPAPALAPAVPRIPDQSATEGQSFQFTAPTFVDPEGDPLTYTFSGLPDWLRVAYPAQNPRYLAGKPPFSESTASTNKEYSITLTATNESGLSASISFQLTVLNSNATPVPPTSIPAQTATEGMSYGYTVPPFTDIDGDPITYSFLGMPGWLKVAYPDVNPRYVAGRPPYTESSLTSDKAYRVAVVASDGKGGTWTTSFDLLVLNVNRAPIASAVATVFAFEGQSVTYTVAAFSDPDGDPISYSTQQLPQWLQFDPASRELNGAPPATDLPSRGVTNYGIEITGTDPGGAAALQSLTLVAGPPTRHEVVGTGRLVGMSADGDWLVHIDDEYFVNRINLSTGESQRHYLGDYYFRDLAPDGRSFVYTIPDDALAGVCETTDGNVCKSVYALDLHTGAKDLLPVGAGDNPFCTISDDRALVAFRNFSLVVYDRVADKFQWLQPPVRQLQLAGSGGRIVVSNLAMTWLHDWSTGQTTTFSDGAGRFQNFRNPSISRDGSLTAIESDLALVTGTRPGRYNVYVRDNNLGTYSLASADENGLEANSPSDSSVISPDGRYVAFHSRATNLVLGKPADAYVKDTVTGAVTPIYGCASPQLSALPTRLACQAGPEVWIVDPIKW